MEIKYSSDEIADALINICYGKEKNKIPVEKCYQLENAIYHLYSICQNEYNNEYFRTFYKILEEITEKVK